MKTKTPPKGTYHVQDTRLIIDFKSGSPRIYWHQMLNALAANGYHITRDPRIEKSYKILGPNHRYCRHGLMELKTEVNDQSLTPWFKDGGRIEFTFYQNTNSVHPHGGQYDSDRYQKMPYLLKMRFRHSLRLLNKILADLGLQETTKPVFKTGEDKIRYEAKGCFHCNCDPITDWQPTDSRPRDYTDADGVRLRPGDTRYLYHYGPIQRAKVYYSLNNMWYAVTGPQNVFQVPSKELFSWKPGTPRRRQVDQTSKVQIAMNQAARALNFERASVCRNWLRSRGGEPQPLKS